MPSYEEDLSEFERRDAQVLGISVDNVPVNEAWARSMGGLSYPLVSDFWPHGYVAAQYGILRGSGTCERAIFVIDKQGIIRYIDIHDIHEQPPTDRIMEALDRLR
jgi:peroxiredoxin